MFLKRKRYDFKRYPDTNFYLECSLQPSIFKFFEVIVDQGEVTEETFYVRVPIFSDLLEDYFWQYDNEGLKNLDVRFYDCSTDVSANDPS